MCPCGGVSSWIGLEEGGDGRCVWRVENHAVAVEESGARHSCWLVTITGTEIAKMTWK